MRRGVVLSIEMALIITATIMLALLAFYGYGKTVLKQVSTEKVNIGLVKAEVWKLPVVGADGPAGFSVTVYVSNLGASPVTITEVGVEFIAYGYLRSLSTGVNVPLNPGETKTVTVVLKPDPSLAGIIENHVREGTPVQVYVMHDGSSVPVTLPTVVLAP